jgi:predicted DNA-binding transcriptional regulator YafY
MSATIRFFWRYGLRRADRMLQIVQILRRRKKPTSARLIAEELEVVPRTVYRDIADLQAQHVPIQGEPGIGYVLLKGYDLPPLMFNEQELEVLVLGAQMVADRSDPEFAKVAEDVLAKVAVVIPDRLSEKMWTTKLLVPHPPKSTHTFGNNLSTIRQAVREHSKLRLEYLDGSNRKSSRRIWPLGLYFYSHVTLLCAWCELRSEFRTFRAERITNCKIDIEKFNPENGDLFKAFMRNWLAEMSKNNAMF